MNPWPQLSVQQFWGQVNWDGRPSAPSGGSTGLSLALTVAQYFAQLPWEGRVSIGAIAKAPLHDEPSPEPPEDLATLEDFLGDISAFF
ncbi:MAG: hypothetical protein HC918_12430 [Oscillatoriales cyanobacterium SM2_1_8]|nr:hypothetical protein [Oscillatoriales cyanobacterium SM2_1_8]